MNAEECVIERTDGIALSPVARQISVSAEKKKKRNRGWRSHREQFNCFYGHITETAKAAPKNGGPHRDGGGRRPIHFGITANCRERDRKGHHHGFGTKRRRKNAYFFGERGTEKEIIGKENRF